jgi:hypothetical protein
VRGLVRLHRGAGRPVEGTAAVLRFLGGGAGERDSLLIGAGWAALALVGATIAIRRDLTGD